jgi:hypothetical protein
VAGAPALTHVSTVGACSTKPRRGPPTDLPGAGVWRSAWGVGALCASTGRWRALHQHGSPRRTPRTHF